jgi:hypothetical protein
LVVFGVLGVGGVSAHEYGVVSRELVVFGVLFCGVSAHEYGVVGVGVVPRELVVFGVLGVGVHEIGGVLGVVGDLRIDFFGVGVLARA